MKIDFPTDPLQAPFRFADLLPYKRFIAYCKERGVRTSEEQLEDFERLGVFFPAIRVKLGNYLEYRVFVDDKRYRSVNESDYKVSTKQKNTIYRQGSSGPSGLEKHYNSYTKDKLIIFPVEEDFIPWKDLHFSLQRNKLEAPTIKGLGKECHETFYSKYQVFVLREVQKMLSLKLIGSFLKKDDEGWVKFGTMMREHFDRSVLYTKRFCTHRNELIKLCCAIDDYYETRSKYIRGDYSSKVKTLDKDLEQKKITKYMYKEEVREQKCDLKSRLEIFDKEKARLEVLEQLDHWNVLADDIVDLYEQFIYELKILDETESIYNYIDTIPCIKLDKTKGTFKYVLEGHNILLRVSSLMKVLNIKHSSMQSIVTSFKSDKAGECSICGRPFFKVKRTDKTCSPGCRKLNQKQLKKDKQYWRSY